MPLFLEKPPLFTVSWKARRSSVQKDGLPSLPGAADGWDSARFQAFFVAMARRFAAVRFRAFSPQPSPVGDNASRWASLADA